MQVSNLNMDWKIVQDCTVGSTCYNWSPNWLNKMSLDGSTYHVVTALTAEQMHGQNTLATDSDFWLTYILLC